MDLVGSYLGYQIVKIGQKIMKNLGLNLIGFQVHFCALVGKTLLILMDGMKIIGCTMKTWTFVKGQKILV